MSAAIYLGIDLGTSGVRGSAIDPQGKELATARLPLPSIQQALDWKGKEKILEKIKSQSKK